MRKEGKLDLIGVSNVTVEQAEQAMELVDVGEVQNAYSILDREQEPLLELCREHEVAFVPFFPLGSAFTGGPAKLAEDPAIAAVAERARRDPEPDRAGVAARPLRPDAAHPRDDARSRTSRRTWRPATSSSTPTTWRALDAVQPTVSASPDHR